MTDFQALTVTFQPEISKLRCKWQVVELRLELPRKKAPGYTGLKHGSLSLAAVWPPQWCSRIDNGAYVKQRTNCRAHYKLGLLLTPAAAFCHALLPGFDCFSQPTALSFSTTMLCPPGLTPLSLPALATPRYFHGHYLTSQHPTSATPALQDHWGATSCTQQYSLHLENAEQGSNNQLTPQ